MIKIYPLKAFTDNYIWVITKENKAIIVDPGQSLPVTNFLQANNLELEAILLTHNHSDHTSGVLELQSFTDKIFGPKECANFCSNIVKEANDFKLLGINIKVLETTGHSAEHISYLIENNFLFCGDSLFSAGCGRVFTKDFNAQFNSLQKFKALAHSTLIFSGHEYTLTNLKWAISKQPNNLALQNRLQQVEKVLANNQPTLPSNIATELTTNLFLQAKNVTEFKNLRLDRDNF